MPEPSMDPIHAMNQPVPGLRFLSPQDAFKELQEGACLVDLRTDELVEMRAFGVPVIYHVPHRFLSSGFTELPKDKLLILADTSGVYTKAAARLLFDNGFTQVACLDGGMIAWEDARLPAVADPEAEIIGLSPQSAATPKSKRPMIQSILFLCVSNSTRSQLAEGVARKLFPGLPIMSAGSRPEPVHPLVVTVLGEIGIDASQWSSKHVRDIDPASAGVVVTLCAEEVLPTLPGNVDHLHWPLPDPASDDSLPDREKQLERFRAVRDAIRKQLEAFGRERSLFRKDG
jgi:arsenate reductase (thioredoxin)